MNKKDKKVQAITTGKKQKPHQKIMSTCPKENYNTKKFLANENKKHIIRLKKIEGQVRGLQKMIAEDRYCIDVITQTSAVRNALRSFEDVILENHLQTCAAAQMKAGLVKKATQEILKVYKLKR